MIFKSVFFFLLLGFSSLNALPFNFFQKETNTSEPSRTLLVIGGIHGNEPGSYYAAALLSQYYDITEGNLWVVPDLNRHSIRMNQRGINGDMNRKFSKLQSNDPDYSIVEEIKKIILRPEVGLILNLHDGHGFYRKVYQNTIFNPNAWGQTCVIDQTNLDNEHPFGDLGGIASQVSQQLNGDLIEDHHLFDVRNTNTRFDDEAMQHSLTYFAVTNNKPAFAIETSKNLPTLHHKVFYQLRAIECYMTFMGIKFKRAFDLTPEIIQTILENNGNITINNNIYMDLADLRNDLSYIPLKSEGNTIIFSHALGNAVNNKGKYDLYVGNKLLTTLSPSIHEEAVCDSDIVLEVDGISKPVKFATDFSVTADFKVKIGKSDTRVNVIGFTPKEGGNEAERLIRLEDFDPSFSVDKQHKTYRVEFYRGNRFCGLVLVHFK